MNTDELIGRGAELVGSRKHTPAAQLPPIGPLPDAAVLMVGALMWPRPDLDPGPVLALVADGDVADPALVDVLNVVRSMIYAGESVGLVLVADEVRRSGRLTKRIADTLLTVSTSGAVPEALRSYACAVVAESLRRRVESAGTALIAAAESMAEDDLAPLAERAAAGIADCAARLAKLRGDGHA